jgi:hypothetical protein
MSLALAPPEPRHAPAERRRLSAPGMHAFVRIADLWSLAESDRLRMLGQPGRSTYYAWVKAAEAGGTLSLSVDTLARLSAVLGIHKALVILFPTAAEGAAWLRRPNAALPFAGQAPLALIAGGTMDGLLQVRRFLDAARGGLHMAPNAADTLPPLRDEDIVIA